MKSIKYFFIGALLMGFSAPAMSQDMKSDIENITKLVKENKSNPAAIKDEIKAFRKNYKKNAEALTALGRAYLDVKDTTNAVALAENALKVNSKYGPGYVLMGDIEVAKDNGGSASAWFEQATMMDPQNIEGYRRYAQVNSKANPTMAVMKLEELRKVRPDYPVDIISAEIFDKAGRLEKAVEYYDKVDRSQMEDYQLAAYATDCFLLGKYEKSLEIAQMGAGKFPSNSALNRLCMFNNTELKKFPEAVAAGKALFACEGAKISGNDHLYYASALKGNKEFDSAIEQYNKAAEVAPEDKDLQISVYRDLSEVYGLKGDIDKAVENFNKYIEISPKRTASMYGQLAALYKNQASKVEGAEMEKYLLEADKVYATIAEQFPTFADYATLQRAHIGFQLDPETKTGAAKPHYEKLVEIVKGHETMDDRDKANLLEAYRYLGYYYTLAKEDAKAAEYWNKVLELDPENAAAKAALGIKE